MREFIENGERRVCIARFISFSLALALLSPGLTYAAQGIDPKPPESTTPLASDIEMEWNLFSTEDEIRLGREAAAALALEIEPAANRDLDAYLEKIRDRLQKPTIAVISLEVIVIPDSSVHSFGFPGGPVYLTAGMLGAAESEAQLAGLIAHQYAHILLRHTTAAASRNERIRIRSVFVAASTGRRTLLNSLTDLSLYIQPASPLLDYRPSSEAAARILGARIMQASGYDAAEAMSLMASLGTSEPSSSSFFLERHPGPIDAIRERPDFADGSEFAQISALSETLGKSSSSAQILTQVRETIRDIKPGVGPRETFVTNSFRVSFPATWKSRKPGPGDRFHAMPKGGVVHMEGSPRILTVGVIAGTLDLQGKFESATDALVGALDEIRPGLARAHELSLPIVSQGNLEVVTLAGESPIEGVREVAWAVSSRKINAPERLLFVLMIAPEAQFPELEPTFGRVIESIVAWPVDEAEANSHSQGS